MTYPQEDTPLVKAEYLVTHKGDMSIELWNDRAQCVLALLAAIVRSAESGSALLTAQKENLHLRLEIAIEERNAARARLAEIERERDLAYKDADHNADQVATLAKALQEWLKATENLQKGTCLSECERRAQKTARAALKAAGVKE